jgi:hypothetical protein
VPHTLTLFLTQFSQENNLGINPVDLLNIAKNKKFKLRQDIIYCAYVEESAKRVAYTTAGPVLRALWVKLSHTARKKMRFEEYTKRKQQLIDYFKNN